MLPGIEFVIIGLCCGSVIAVNTLANHQIKKTEKIINDDQAVFDAKLQAIFEANKLALEENQKIKQQKLTMNPVVADILFDDDDQHDDLHNM